jgi:hypothetical protein
MWHIKLPTNVFEVYETYFNFKMLRSKLVKISHIEFKQYLRFMGYVWKYISDIIHNQECFTNQD